MKTEAEIKHEYEATRAKFNECAQELDRAIDNLGRFRYGSRDNKIAWKNFASLESESHFLAIRLGTLRFVLDMPPLVGEDEVARRGQE